MTEKRTQKVQGGAEHVLYKTLLDTAHGRFERWSMEVEIIQFASPENGDTTVCKATVTIMDGDGAVTGRFVEIGDANPGNVSGGIRPHCPRMAATRAKGRALRDALNIGEVMREELSDGGGSNSNNRPQAKATRTQLTRIRTLATDLSGGDEEAGVAKVEERAGSLTDLSRDDAETWISRLEK